MAYYEHPGFRLGNRQEGLSKEHFGFTEAAARVEAESHLDEDSAAILQRDSANTENIRPNGFVTVDEKPFDPEEEGGGE